MKESLAAGIANEMTRTVTAAMSPPHLPGLLATSQMISLMEDTCLQAVQPHLDEPETTVGIHVDVSHVGAAYAGEEVTARIRLAKITRHRLLSFEVEVHSPRGVISTGTHQRLVVEKSRFDQAQAPR